MPDKFIYDLYMEEKKMKRMLSVVLAFVMILTAASMAMADELTNLNTYETKARELETWNIH